jgi:hypothetical protein
VKGRKNIPHPGSRESNTPKCFVCEKPITKVIEFDNRQQWCKKCWKEHLRELRSL